MRLVLITFLALTAVSCRAQTPVVDPKSAATTNNGPTIVLKGESLTYNGKPLPFNTPIAAWQEVLGPSTKCDGDDGKTFKDLHCWNNLGIMVETSYKNHIKVKNLYIFLNQRPKPEGYDLLMREDDGTPMTLLDIYHKHIFTGRLEIDGATIDRTFTVLDVVKQNNYSYNCLAELRDCWVGTADPYYETGFSTDSRLQKGTIYVLQISVMAR